jgi:F0F1-type ATP synthase delta subunit
MAAAKTSRRVLAQTVASQLLAEPEKHKRIMQGLAAYLVEHKMVDDAKLVMSDIAHELFVQGGDLPVTVVSARRLSGNSLKELESVLKSATGARKVALAQETDENLLGGFIARTPDAEIDASVRTRLKQLAAIK